MTLNRRTVDTIAQPEVFGIRSFGSSLRRGTARVQSCNYRPLGGQSHLLHNPDLLSDDDLIAGLHLVRVLKCAKQTQRGAKKLGKTRANRCATIRVHCTEVSLDRAAGARRSRGIPGSTHILRRGRHKAPHDDGRRDSSVRGQRRLR
jgi:hypothetical protein